MNTPQELCDHTNCLIKALNGLKGGKMRKNKGDVFERILKPYVVHVWRDRLGQDPSRLKVEKFRFKYGTKPSGTRYKYSDLKDMGNHGVGLDTLVFVDDVLIMVIEAKSYADITMLKRAQSEYESLCHRDKLIKFVVFQGENALGGELHTQAVCDRLSAPELMPDSLIEYLDDRKEVCGSSCPLITFITLIGRRRGGKGGKKDMSTIESPVRLDRVIACLDFFAQTLGAYA